MPRGLNVPIQILNTRFRKMSSILWASLALTGLISTGCVPSAIRETKTPAENALVQETEESRQWKLAMDAFAAKDYATAHDIFEVLSHEAKDPHIKRQALFGMACTRLILAKTTAEVQRALKTWSLWENQVSNPPVGEDPRLLTPLLEKLPSLHRKLTRCLQRRPSPRPSVEYKKIIEEKDKTIEELRQRLQALESIHRQIEEKKKAVGK